MHLCVETYEMYREFFLLYRKYRVTLKCESYDSYRAKSPSGGSHCGGMESCRLCDPPQAENPALQDSFLFHESKTDYEVKKTENTSLRS